MSKGLYIVFEGIVGSGKTTQLQKLADYFEQTYPSLPVTYTFEPGGSEIANSIRTIVQGTNFSETMDPLCEAYLFAASRAQTLAHFVKPKVEYGEMVVSDRNFTSSLAYQGYVRGLGFETILDINHIAIADCLPDKVFYLDIEPHIGLKRTFDKAGDKFENESVDFFEKVREGYTKAAELDLLKNRFKIIDAMRTVDEVHEQITDEIEKLIATKDHLAAHRAILELPI